MRHCCDVAHEVIFSHGSKQSRYIELILSELLDLRMHFMTQILPSFNELPSFQGFTGCAWEVWGKDDQLGTVNLLTDDVVKEAATEIK